MTLFCRIILLFLVLSPAASLAAQNSILVLTSGKTPVYKTVTGQLKVQISKLCSGGSDDCQDLRLYELNTDENKASLAIPANTRLIITLGLKAAKAVQTLNTGLPVIHALLPKNTADPLLTSSNQTAIYLDQPIARQFKLARLIKDDPHVGLLLGSNTVVSENQIQQLSKQLSTAISYRKVHSEDRVGPLLKELLEESNLLLALPDPSVFNRRTIFNILLSSYHNKVPVIGFSSAYVKAGALISVFSKPEDIARHLAEFSSAYLLSNKTTLPAPVYPKYFSIEVNRSVARSLDISLPDEHQIIKLMNSDSK